MLCQIRSIHNRLLHEYIYQAINSRTFPLGECRVPYLNYGIKTLCRHLSYDTGNFQRINQLGHRGLIASFMIGIQ